jgi:hypothetical protein
VSDRLHLRNALWVGFGLRLIIALWNGFFGPSFGAEGDGVGLDRLAADVANGNPPEMFRISLSYIYLLGAIYWLITPSSFLGSLLSCFVWLISTLIMVASMRLLGASLSSRAKAAIICGVIPSSVLWTGITMREPYQLLAVNTAMYAALHVVLRNSWRHWALLLAATAIGALSHAVLLVWCAGVIVVTFALGVSARLRVSPVRLATAAVAILVFAYVGFKVFTEVYYPIPNGLVHAVSSYQAGGLAIGVRTNYRSSVALTSTLDLLVFIPTALFQYLFEPMPWRVSSISDLVPLAENLLRLGLIAQAIALLLRLPRHACGPVFWALTAFVGLETLWALGTFNWGTAARHHIPSYGLLLIAAYGAAGKPLDVKRHDSSGPSLNVAA